MANPNPPGTPRSPDKDKGLLDVRFMEPRKRTEIRLVIIRALAHYKTPGEVQRMLEEEYGVQMTTIAIRRYSPETRSPSQRKPNKRWRCAWTRERRKYLENLERIPIANQAWRLQELEALYREAKGKKLTRVAMDALMNAEKMVNPPGRPGLQMSAEVPGEDGPVRIRLNLFEDVSPPAKEEDDGEG